MLIAQKDAISDNEGLFDAAWIDLEEIGLNRKIELLWAFDGKDHTRVGGNGDKKSACRILFATNRDLDRW